MNGKEAALACQRAEQRATGVQVGGMDQFASARGGRGSALLLDCGTLEYQVIPFPDEVAIAVIDSGEHRSLADTPYNQRRREAEAGHPRLRKHVGSGTATSRGWVPFSENPTSACATISRCRRPVWTRSSNGHGPSRDAWGRASWAPALAAGAPPPPRRPRSRPAGKTE